MYRNILKQYISKSRLGMLWFNEDFIEQIEGKYLVAFFANLVKYFPFSKREIFVKTGLCSLMFRCQNAFRTPWLTPVLAPKIYVIGLSKNNIHDGCSSEQVQVSSTFLIWTNFRNRYITIQIDSFIAKSIVKGVTHGERVSCSQSERFFIHTRRKPPPIFFSVYGRKNLR